MWYFEHPDLDFDVKNYFFIKYLPIARPKLVPKWKMLRIYWNLIKIEIWYKYLIKTIFDIKIKISVFKCAKFQDILRIFNFETNLGLLRGKYLIKIIFHIKIKIGIHSFLYKHKLYKFYISISSISLPRLKKPLKLSIW